MKKIFLLTLTLLVTLAGHGQMPDLEPGKGLIVGKVTDGAQESLQYVNIILKNSKTQKITDAVATDEEGKFVLKNVPFGTYDLELKFIGFQNKTIKNIEVNKANRFVKIGKISLSADDQSIGEVVVQSQAKAVSYKLDKKVVNVTQDVQASGGDATDALRNVPSINVDVNGDVTLRGSSNFIVMINGKPSILDPNDALKQIPVSNIQKIEIITNPSAKYDPDGDAGIINIITKNKTSNGLSGKIEAGIDNNLAYHTALLLNYRKNKFEFMTQLNMNKRTRPMLFSLEQTTFFPTDTFNITSTGINQWGHGSGDAKIGFAFYPNDKNTFSINASYGKKSFIMNGISTQEFYYDGQTPQYLQTVSTTNAGGNNFNIDLNYEHKFNDKGHKITSYVQYSFYKPQVTTTTTSDTTDANQNPIGISQFGQQSQENRNREKARFEIDYENPINDNMKIEAGYVFRYLNAGGPYHYYQMINGNWTEIDDQYNEMTLYRQIHAAYLTFAHSTPWFDYKIGLRTEYTDRLVTEKSTDSQYPVNRFDYFPSVHISKQLPHDQQLQLSYSRRINRPRGWNLNPFPRFINQYTIRQGNPGLNPEYANSFELNYIKKMGKNSLSIETYYKITEGKIDRIISTEGTTIIYTAANINKDYSLGSELSANIVLMKLLMLNISGNVYNYRLVGTLDGKPVDKQTLTWNTNFYLMTFLPTGTGIQIGGFYNAPTVTAQGTRQGMLVTFAAVRQSFFKRKLNVSIKVNDIFKTMNFSFTSESDSFYSVTSYSSLHPTVGITLTYRINNYKGDRRKGQMQNNSMDFMGEGDY